jgi:uncharacterized RDD family membrane protein YckC
MSQSTPPVPSGLAYADVPNRIIAYIIDIIILFLIGLVVAVALGAVGLTSVTISANGDIDYNPVANLIVTIVGLAVNAAYFIYTWTRNRGTVGMKVLGMQVGNAGDGATLTQDQGIRRFIALGAPFTLAQALNPLPGLGFLIGIAAFAWLVFLLYSTATSPTKQGWHDHFANSQVVKAVGTVN